MIQYGKNLSYSEKRILLTLFSEIVLRDNLDCALACQTFQDLLFMDDPIKQVMKIRYPMQTEMHDAFKSLFENKLLIGTGVRLMPPADFEGDSFQIHFQFNSAGELDKRLKALQFLTEHTNELFSFLQ